MTKRNESIKELLQLISENPELRIAPMVDSEIVGGDYSWYLGSWGKAKVDEIYVSDERIYLRSEDEETLVEDLCFGMDNEEGLSDDDLYKLAEKEVSEYAWEKVITVSINTP